MFQLTVDSEIQLKLLMPEDRHEVFRVVHASRKHLEPFLPWVKHVQSPDDYLHTFRSWLEQFAHHQGFHTGIMYQSQFVGMVGLHGIDWNRKKTSIGYWLAKEFEGKGIMTRACRKVVEVVFGKYHLNRIEIHCAKNNMRSRTLAERLGFIQEGMLRQAAWCNGQHDDLVVYGLLKEDWAKTHLNDQER